MTDAEGGRQQVGDRPADQHRRPPHGKGPEPVDGPGVQVGTEADRGAHGRGGQVQQHQAGDGEVLVAAALDRHAGAEHVDEQQREEDRLHGHVGELQRLPGDVHQVAAGEHDDVVHTWRPASSGGPGPATRVAGQGGGRRRHAEAPSSSGAGSGVVGSSPAVGWPVRAKKTSSSDGWRTSTSSTRTPAASRARTTVVASPGPAPDRGLEAGARPGSRGSRRRRSGCSAGTAPGCGVAQRHRRGGRHRSPPSARPTCPRR